MSRLASRFRKSARRRGRCTPLAMHDQRRHAALGPDRHGAAPARLVHDEVRHAAQRDLDARPHLRPLRHLGQPLLQPALMAVEEAVDLAARQAGRHGDAQALAAGVDAQRQPPGAVVLDDPQRQRAAGNDMLALLHGRGDVGVGRRWRKPKGMLRNDTRFAAVATRSRRKSRGRDAKTAPPFRRRRLLIGVVRAGSQASSRRPELAPVAAWSPARSTCCGWP